MTITCYASPYIPFSLYPWCTGLEPRPRCFPCPLSSAEVQEFVISIRCAKCTAGAKSNGSIRRRTSARCVSISRTSLSFSRPSMDFSTLAKFDSLKLTETHGWLCGYSLHLFFWSLISYFLRNEAKCFTLKAPPKPVGVVVHVVFFSWNNNNVAVDSEFHCSLQELYLHGKYELR